MSYQKVVLRKPFDTRTAFECGYDFFAFYKNAVAGKKAELKKEKTKIEVVPKTQYESLSEYAKETVWFGRRRGATVYSDSEIDL